MAHLIDRHAVVRANTELMLSMVWCAFAVCAFGALLYDVARWLN